MKIKICGMREADNIRDVGLLDPDYMGFIFYNLSKRYVGERVNQAIRKFSHRTTRKVGVFVNEDPGVIQQMAGLYSFDLIQLHGKETAAHCKELQNSGFSVMKAFGLHQDFNFQTLTPYVPYCSYFLFDTSSAGYGGSGKKFNWEQLEKYTLNTPFFLSGGIGPGDAEEVVSLAHPALYAVDINSRFETIPGVKDVGLVREFVERVRMIV